MATQTVAAGGGNWSSSTTWAPGSIPIAGDDVILNASSGQLTIDINTNIIRSLICTGYTGTITHNAVTPLNIGGVVAPAGNVALVFVAGMTYTLVDVATSNIVITDSSGATNTYNFNGATLGNLTINNGTTTTTQLVTSGFTQGAATTVTLAQGGLDTNGQSCTWGSFTSNNTNTRTLTMGSSSITLTNNNSIVWNITTGTNLVITNNTATITGSSSAFAQTYTFYGLNYNGVSLVFNATGTTTFNSSTGTFANITYNPATTNANNIKFNANITITGNLTLTGSSSPLRILVSSVTNGTQITLTCNGTVTASYVDFRDIKGAGSASWNLSGITGGSGDCQGNSSITLTTTQTNYFKGSANDNFSRAAYWYLATNGGGGAGRVPLPQDNAIFDANSGVNTYQFDTPRIGTITTTGFTGTLSFISLTVQCYGNITWGSGITLTASQVFAFWGRGSQTITTNGIRYNNNYNLNAFVGTYTQQDNLSTNTFTFTTGTWSTNNFNIISAIFTNASAAGSPVTINMGSGIWTIYNSVIGQTPWAFGITAGLTLNCNTSTINWTPIGNGTWYFVGGNQTYYNFSWPGTNLQTQTLVMSNNNIFNSFSYVAAAALRTIQLAASSTQAIGTLSLQGQTGYILTINSNLSGTAATFSVATGIVSANNISLTDNTASGGANFFAGNNSTIGTNVTGWNQLNSSFLNFM